MGGGKKIRRTAAILFTIWASCVGLGDTSSPSAAQEPEIPLVPLPSLTQQSAKKQPASPQGADAPRSSAPQQGADAPRSPALQTPPHTARQLLQQAIARCAVLDSYIVRLTRREYHRGKANPEEIMMFKFRRQPFSVHFKWLGQAAKGREVIYVKGRYDNKIHTRLAAGDAPLMPAGTRLSVAPDSMLARSASRHPITHAGICHGIETLNAILTAQERGDRRLGTLTVLAPQRRPEYPQPVETMEWILPPGAEPNLPRGGRRLLCFDPQWHLPMLVVTYDNKGKEVEYYHYDRLQTPVNLDDDDFNPDKQFPSKRAKKTQADGSFPH